ncbi:hypothetical protein EDC04DRAFT_2964511 [Pisolithus marmoratus]|nr:hypothetical protein EDC04DRAFT_2964511 [Pisolithus marmoratus]
MPSISLPVFPDGIPIHSLLAINFELLKVDNQAEIDCLWEATVTLGFWYLKNHGAEQEVEAMFDLGMKAFALPLEEKLKYEQGDSSRLFRYKKIGRNAHKDTSLVSLVNSDSTGRLPDMVKFWNIAKDDVLAFPDVVHRTYPPMVTPVIPSIVRPFVCKSLKVNNTILWIFTQQLGLPKGTLEELHSHGLPSGSEARVTRGPLMPGKDTADCPTIGAHTNFGSLALLHNILGGLQVLLPGETQWHYVKLICGHAICNIGDALTVFSSGILKSSVHQVAPPPGAQGEHEHWSLVFHTRPNDTQILRPLVEHSPVIAESVKQFPKGKFETGSTVAEWYSRRIKYQRLRNREGPKSWAASRGTEHDPGAR